MIITPPTLTIDGENSLDNRLCVQHRMVAHRFFQK